MKCYKQISILFLGIIIPGCFDAPEELENNISFGCYSGPDLPKILINKDNMIIDQEPKIVVKYSVRRGKHWDYIETPPIRLEKSDDRVVFRYYDGVGTFWPVLLNARKVIYHMEPLSKVGGDEIYTRIDDKFCQDVEGRNQRTSENIIPIP